MATWNKGIRKVSLEISIELFNKIQVNKRYSTRVINVGRIAELAIEQEFKKLEEEMTPDERKQYKEMLKEEERK